ncbi:MAG: hypothetical protein GWM92_09725, partial [Gemmatimonadetes bacterium]|nr:hypothetical protein [Gemmatimonadota bacterium]NIR78341.1 hypothetical protein [Gemmatimonadota bacterium]NIT87578.1 hypothetical protein [Gemmatimonadota bacterium]NIU31444.1 hypothetical protein [Gemmatimonadota bacterium]NIU36125.1 hypothetical protein [Gemmatimonadota bacterium]
MRSLQGWFQAVGRRGRRWTRSAAVATALAVVLAGAGAAAPAAAQEGYDVLIRDGRVLDGSG